MTFLSLAMIAHKTRLIVSGLILLTVALTAVPARAAAALTIRVAMPTGTVSSLDPLRVQRFDANTRDLAENLFVGLTRYDALSGHVVPLLARDWSVSADGLTWTFNLRDDVSWVKLNSDTQQNPQIDKLRTVTAGDVVYALRRACLPAQSPNSAGNIVNAVYIIQGCVRVAIANPSAVDEAFIAKELGVRATNDHTLELQLAFPAPYLPAVLTLPVFRPFPQEAVEKGVEKSTDWAASSSLLLSSGPWVVSTWTPDQRLTLIRNPYWPADLSGTDQGPQAGSAPDQIEVNFTPADQIAEQFSSSSSDYAHLDSASAAALRQSKPDSVVRVPDQSVTVLGFSVERNVVKNQQFRRVLAQAIDRGALPGVDYPASSFMPPDALAGQSAQLDISTKSAPVPTDIDGRKALADMGYPGCKLPERLTLVVENRPDLVALAKALQSQWQTALGCRSDAISLKPSPASYVIGLAHGAVDVSDRNAPPRPQMWIASWRPDYPDANAWLSDGLHCQFGYLRPGESCGAADKLLDAAALETDPEQRADQYRQAEASWFGTDGTFPVVPLYFTANVVARQPALQNVVTASLGNQWYTAWRVVK